MHQTKKGHQWHFGMKIRVGSDAETGVAHSFAATGANASDVAHAHRLLHGKEKRAWGDAGYRGGEEARREKDYASVRAKAEHPFFYVKRMFGYGKVRYRGLHKNAQRIALLLGFANLLISERPGGVIAAPVCPDGGENAQTGVRTCEFDGPMRPETRKIRAKPDDGDPPLEIATKSDLP